MRDNMLYTKTSDKWLICQGYQNILFVIHSNYFLCGLDALIESQKACKKYC